MANTTPINVDEFLHNGQAKKVVNWYVTLGADDSCLQNIPDNLRYYGQSVDNLAALINHTFNIEKEYNTRHYVGALVGWFLLLAVGNFTRYLTGSFLVSILAMLLLIISPRPFGQVFGNLKDIPFALGYIWATFGIVKFVKELPLPSFKTTFFLASGIAFANSVRIGGSLLFFTLGLFVFLWFVLNRKNFALKNELIGNRKHYFFNFGHIKLLDF